MLVVESDPVGGCLPRGRLFQASVSQESRFRTRKCPVQEMFDIAVSCMSCALSRLLRPEGSVVLGHLGI